MHSINRREVSSSANPLMKVFRRSLADGTTREGWLAVEGPFLVEEALSAAPVVQTHSVLVASGAAAKFSALLDRLPAEIELTQVPDRLFEGIAQTQSPQGIAALVELPAYKLEQVVAVPNPLLVVACRLQDPGNLGTMMRTALAFSASAFLTLQETVSPFNPKAVRSSAGAIFRLPLICGLNPEKALPFLSVHVRIIAADRNSPASLSQANLKGPIAMLVGREASGLPEEIARYANQRLSIPIRKEVDSVNAATAASIFLYEAARQRGFRY
ncbi:MAG: TrmH family RNA methyltransferase [Terriglobia bacterium]